MTNWKIVIVLLVFGFILVIGAIILGAFNGLLFSNMTKFSFGNVSPAEQFANDLVYGIGGLGFLLIIIAVLFASFSSRNSNQTFAN